MPSQCMVLQQTIQAVPVVCYVLVTVLQIIDPYWVLEDTSLQIMAQWIGKDPVQLQLKENQVCILECRHGLLVFLFHLKQVMTFMNTVKPVM